MPTVSAPGKGQQPYLNSIIFLLFAILVPTISWTTHQPPSPYAYPAMFYFGIRWIVDEIRWGTRVR